MIVTAAEVHRVQEMFPLENTNKVVTNLKLFFMYP